MRLFAKPYTDQEILLAIANGKDDKALSFLYKEVLPKVKGYILKNNGTREEAQDIFQDAVIRFYHAVKENRFHEKCSISTFLFGISKNLWLNFQRDKNRIDKSGDATFVQDSVNLLEDIISEEKIAAVNDLLSGLGEGCEKLLRYSVFDNLSMKEISDKMGYANENVAKTNNYRCKQKLIQLVSNNPTVLDLFNR